MGFDRPDEASSFLSFVRKEFSARGTRERARLADKTRAHELVRELGLKAPRKMALIDDVGALRGADLPEICVLKYAHGWSTKGVHLLERYGDDLWFDHLSLRLRSLREVAEAQNRVAEAFGGKRAWIVEEMVRSTIPGRTIPFDYKFYCFRDAIGLIVQIDRNASPPRLTLLDGDFVPLVHGRDYVIRSANAQPGPPIVPRNAPELAWWARELSMRTDSPFVSIDLYDSPEGPVFGEFTFSPGGTHKRMWLFAHATLDRLDALFEAAADLRRAPQPASLEALQALPRPTLAQYGALAAYACGGGIARGADRFVEFYGRAAKAAGPGETADRLRALRRPWVVIRERAKIERQREAQRQAARVERAMAAPAKVDAAADAEGGR